MAPIIDRTKMPSRRLDRTGNRSSKAMFLAVTVAAFLTMAAIVGLMAQIGGNGGSPQAEIPDKAPARIFYTMRPPIFISGNEEFTNASGVSWGSGTSSDPYIIADWDIDASSAHGIQIVGTDAHFVITNCYIHDGVTGTYYGVRLEDVSNGTVIGNIFSTNWFGVYLRLSNSIAVRDNLCSDNHQGVFLQNNADWNVVDNNTCTLNVYEGIVVDNHSDNNTLTDNNCSGNGEDGIFIDGSSNNTVEGNNCSDTDYGIIVTKSSFNNTLVSNTCSSNSYDGIYMTQSSNNRLDRNNCSANLAWGIQLYSSTNNTLIRNNCSSNGNDGISLDTSDGNTLVSNTGFWNAYNGVNVVSSRDNTLVTNTWSLNSYHGVYLGYSADNTLDSNNCSSNGQYGILIRDSTSNTLLRNQLCGNLQYGVYIWSSSTCNLVFNNTFMGNNGAGSTYDPGHVQAYDEEPGNWWNSTDGYGNYWSDWTSPDDVPPYGIVDVPYDIAGGAGAKDYYPQTTPLAPIPEFGAMPLVAISLLVAVLLARSVRRKAP